MPYNRRIDMNDNVEVASVIAVTTAVVLTCLLAVVLVHYGWM